MKENNLVILAGGISSRMKNSEAHQKIGAELLRDAGQKPKAMIGVGKDGRPFLDYLLFNAREAGYRDIVIVIGEHDDSVKACYGKAEKGNEFHGLTISYAIQSVPPGRTKPLGTADALHRALVTKPEWKGRQFTVCNSDNLYSVKVLKLLLDSTYPNMLIDYDRDALKFSAERVQQFAVTKKDDAGFLLDIIEKPSAKDIEDARGKDGSIRVSMNIFRLSYDQITPLLETIPLHPVRNEKELPLAIKMMILEHPKSMFAWPLAERVVDLTSKEDIVSVQSYLEKKFPNFSF